MANLVELRDLVLEMKTEIAELKEMMEALCGPPTKKKKRSSMSQDNLKGFPPELGEKKKKRTKKDDTLATEKDGTTTATATATAPAKKKQKQGAE